MLARDTFYAQGITRLTALEQVGIDQGCEKRSGRSVVSEFTPATARRRSSSRVLTVQMPSLKPYACMKEGISSEKSLRSILIQEQPREDACLHRFLRARSDWGDQTSRETNIPVCKEGSRDLTCGRADQSNEIINTRSSIFAART